MTDINVYLAQENPPDSTPELVITARKELPACVLPPGGNQELMKIDAQKIADALYRHLPGGTLDRLLVRLMEKTVSQLVVRHKIVREEQA